MKNISFNIISMNIVMIIKKLLRHLGYDIIRYHSFWDTVVRPRDIKTIIDIGANTGPFSLDVRMRFPLVQIYAFEPLNDCFSVLTSSMSNDSKFRAWNIALGEVGGEITMHRSSFHPSSSLLPMTALHKKIYPKSTEKLTEVVEIRRLDDVMRDIALEKPVLIKMDVQGFEDAVIRGGKDTIAQADILLIETSFVQLYESQPIFDDIYQLVCNLGFTYLGRSAEHHNPKTGERIYEDSIFVRQDA